MLLPRLVSVNPSKWRLWFYSPGKGMSLYSLSLPPSLFYPCRLKQQRQTAYSKKIREAKALLSLQNTHTHRDKLWTTPDPPNTQTRTNRRDKAEALISLLSMQGKGGRVDEERMKGFKSSSEDEHAISSSLLAQIPSLLFASNCLYSPLLPALPACPANTHCLWTTG